LLSDVKIAAASASSDSIGQPVVRGAAVEQTGDVRVIERREDPALGAKSLQHLRGIHAALDHLDRDVLLELTVDAICEQPAAAVPQRGGNSRWSAVN
jgi:hypothetical protein